MSNPEDERNLAAFKKELPARQAVLQAAKDQFKANEDREIFQRIAASMTVEERSRVATELKAESQLLLSRVQERQSEIRELEADHRQQRVDAEVDKALNRSVTGRHQANDRAPSLTFDERAEAVARLRAESNAIKNLIENRKQQIKELDKLNRDSHER